MPAKGYSEAVCHSSFHPFLTGIGWTARPACLPASPCLLTPLVRWFGVFLSEGPREAEAPAPHGLRLGRGAFSVGRPGLL